MSKTDPVTTVAFCFFEKSTKVFWVVSSRAVRCYRMLFLSQLYFKLIMKIFPTTHEGQHWNNAEITTTYVLIPSLSAHYGHIPAAFYDQWEDRESVMPSVWFQFNVNGQYSVIIMALCSILHQKSTVFAVALHVHYFLSLKSWLLQLQPCCPWLFAVSHYKSVKAARADVF